ncbi:unnamed protein product, partial [Prorocentrum cordatum]
ACGSDPCSGAPCRAGHRSDRSRPCYPRGQKAPRGAAATPMADNVTALSVAVACKASAPICKAGGSGMILPLSEHEAEMEPALRVVVYGFMMLYFFVGVAIIADIFVASIEEITARWKQTTGKDGKVRTTKVWNETVATLTLMALGSSAPEIFVALIDVFKKEFHAAQLGPSTIAGSASFNLLVIVAVCIMVIPSNEVRVIKELPSFYITAAFSLGAYLWAAFILVVNTKDQVDPWEAIVTFLFLPLLVWMSYKSDEGAVVWILVKLGFIEHDKADLATHLHGARPSQFVVEVRSSLRGSSGEEAVEVAKTKVALVGFPQEHLVVALTNEDQKIKIPLAASGYRGNKDVKVRYTTRRLTAVPDVEYTHVEGGVVVFDEEETEQFIELTIGPWSGNKLKSSFLLVLDDAQGADFDPDTDGGDQCAILTVSLRADGPLDPWRRVVGSIVDIDGFHYGLTMWREQLANSIYVGGDPEEHREASATDWALHLVNLPWKLLFALIPHPCFFGGWLCFAGSLLGIAALTSVVSDLAELFGCVLGIGDVVTAITFVALGTSMPDLFASLAACKEDETADASVVNVTGSNSVNVFLGLGLPWSICSIYWAFKERTSEWAACYPETAARLDAGGHGSSMVFVVDSGFIGFSVVTFCCVCLSAIAIVMIRRKYLHAELGGPFVPKITCGAVLIFFWLSWIFVVSWRVLRYEDQTLLEQAVVGFAFLCVVLLGLMFAFASVYKHRLSSVQVREAREVRRFSAETGSIDLSSVQGFAGQPGDKAASLGELPSAERIGSKDQSSGELTPATDCDQSGRGVAPHCNLVEGV